MKKRLVCISLVVLTSVGATLAPTAAAETLECTEITSIPTTVSTQGVYCLFANLSTGISAGNAIEIATSNVTLDLNGWKLGGLAAGDGTEAVGIYSDGPNNITIRNGTIRGFRYGINLDGGQGHLIEDIRAEGNTTVGIRAISGGILIRRNQVVDTGGSTVDTSAIGISVSGAGPRVLGNDVSSVEGETSSYGILSANTAGAFINGNRISNVSDGTGIFTVSTVNSLIQGNGISTTDGGIFAGPITLNVLITGNTMSGTTNSGVSFHFMAPPAPSSTGGYRGNTVFGSSTPYSGGTDLGGNEP